MALISINSCFLYILKGINGSNTLHDSENDSPNIMNDSLKRKGMPTKRLIGFLFSDRRTVFLYHFCQVIYRTGFFEHLFDTTIFHFVEKPLIRGSRKDHDVR